MQSECVYGVEHPPLPRFGAKLVANLFLGISFPFHCLFSAEINPRVKKQPYGNIRLFPRSGTDFSLCPLPRRESPTDRDSRRQTQAGRNYRAELRSSSSASFHRRCNSPPRHPGISVAQPILAVLFSFRPCFARTSALFRARS